jgi:GxxExxY protein
MAELLLGDEVYAIIGAAIEVHRELGCGYLEAVYQEGLELELCCRNVPFQPQCELKIHYKGQPLKKHYCADFVCYGTIIVEIKAAEKLTTKDEAQLLNYLKTTGLQVGLLINFGSTGKLEWKRFVR